MALGSILGAGASLLGGFLGDRSSKRAARAVAQASQPFSVVGPFGSALFDAGSQTLRTSLSPALQAQLDQFGLAGQTAAQALGAFDFDRTRSQELERLRAIQLPEEERRRQQVRQEQFRRGRLGFGVGGVRSGAFANPELGALAEAEALSRLLRDQQALEFAGSEQARLLNAAGALTGLQTGLAGFPTSQATAGIQSRNPAAAFAGLPGTRQAQMFDAMFSRIADRLGTAFSGGGGGGNFINLRSTGMSRV